MKSMNDSLELDLLEVPILEERPWAVFAACHDSDPELFFPASRMDEDRALALCAICPVEGECLDYALESRERFGIWGGTTDKERRKLIRRIA